MCLTDANDLLASPYVLRTSADDFRASAAVA
jgi:hypothetical protein